jgi:MFS family permease
VLLRWLGDSTIMVSFVAAGFGAALMCLGPGLAARVIGLAIVGGGAAPLYPLTVDRLYAQVGDALDSVTLGAYCALASGVAVTIGPLLLGVLADRVGLRWAILIVPALALLGAMTQRPRRR